MGQQSPITIIPNFSLAFRLTIISPGVLDAPDKEHVTLGRPAAHSPQLLPRDQTLMRTWDDNKREQRQLIIDTLVKAPRGRGRPRVEVEGGEYGTQVTITVWR